MAAVTGYRGPGHPHGTNPMDGAESQGIGFETRSSSILRTAGGVCGREHPGLDWRATLSAKPPLLDGGVTFRHGGERCNRDMEH